MNRVSSAAVWVARLLTGATFIISGWTKAIDPWGFIIKVGEYLTAWGMHLPRELILAGCASLACVEFTVGVLLATGSLKRTASVVAGVMMAFMLPLTLYIAIANPVSDCGCFGDFLIISNWATFSKNVVLTALVIFLIIKSPKVPGIYSPSLQWLVVTASLLFTIFLAAIGYHVQPLVDFRPYKLGTQLFGRAEVSDDAASDVYYIYEKNGRQERFNLDALPDSTWNYVDAVERGYGTAPQATFAVLDRDGDDVSADLAANDGKMLYLVVAEPDMHFLSRAHFVSELNRYAGNHEVQMVGIVGASGASLDRWQDLVRPYFPVYSAENTALKQLVRGDAALVYTRGDSIVWKRNISSVDEKLLSPGTACNFDQVYPIDNGRTHLMALCAYLCAMLLIYLLSLAPKILRHFVQHTKKKCVTLHSQKNAQPPTGSHF